MNNIKSNWSSFLLGLMCCAVIAASFTTYSYAPAISNTNILRPLNTSYKPSEQRDCYVVYSGNITCTSSLLNASGGRMILEISTNGTTWTPIDTQYANIGSGLVDTKTFPIKVSGTVPKNNFAKIRTDNAAGTPVYVIRAGTELYFN